MLLSRASQYTLQALIYLAQQPIGQVVMVKTIAEQLGLPEFYLGKLIQAPVRAGWLASARGRGGGVKLHADAATITLLDILHPTDGHRVTRECLLGLKACEDETACVLHCQWQPIKQELTEGLGGYTLAALANAAIPAWLLDRG
jgi:Rrf2 family protein